jgi:hypothetical protein
MGNVTVALSFNNGGLTFDPTIPTSFNTLKLADHLHGYWLKMNAVDTLSVTGLPTDPQTPLLLSSDTIS